MIDLRFSRHSTLLCSIDVGTGPNEAHVIVWAPDDKAFGLNFASVLKLKLTATLVQAHPELPFLWLIANKSSIAVFSSLQQEQEAALVQSYSDLPTSVTFESPTVVKDAVFSKDGNSVLAALSIAQDSTQSFLQLYRLTEDGAFDGKIGMTPMVKVPIGDGVPCIVQDFLCMSCVSNDHVVTVKKCLVEDPSLSYTLQVWKYTGSDLIQSIPLIQSITVELPLFASRMASPSTSLTNQALQCALSTEPSASPRYLILSCRRSSHAVCFGLTPAGTGTGKRHPLPVFQVHSMFMFMFMFMFACLYDLNTCPTRHVL